MEFVRKCERCQMFSNLHHALTEVLHKVTPPWPFYQWGVDIHNPFPKAPRQVSSC